MIHKKPDGTVYVSWRDENRKQHTKPFGKGDIAAAQAKQHNAKLKLDKKLGKSTLPAEKATLRLDRLAQVYINHCKANGKTGKWLDGSRKKPSQCALASKALPQGGRSAHPAGHDDFINENYGHVKQITRNRYLDYLKVIFNYGVVHGLTENNPLAKWKKGKEESREMFLTVSDLMKIRSYADPHLKLAIDLIWHTGIRPGPKELFSLRWEQVDFNRKVIRVLGKRNMWREVAVNDILEERLLEQKEISKAIALKRKRNLQNMWWNTTAALSGTT